MGRHGIIEKPLFLCYHDDDNEDDYDEDEDEDDC